MKQLTEDEQYKIGDAIIGAALPLLPKGITWTYEGKGNERATKKAIGSAAEEATREMHNEARDAEWEQAIRSYAHNDDVAECWIRNFRALLVSRPQSLEERVRQTLIDLQAKKISFKEADNAIAALVKERTGGTE